MVAVGSAKKKKSKIISFIRLCLLASRQAIKMFNPLMPNRFLVSVKGTDPLTYFIFHDLYL